MNKYLKIIMIIILIPIVLLFLFIMSFVIIGKMYEKGIFTHKYEYIESIENQDKRYSLYSDYGRDGYSWFIFEHDIDYERYKEVERTQVSLNVYNNNPNDKFIYYFIPNDFTYKSAKIEIFLNKFLVLNIDGLYHFLYDVENGIKYDFKKSINIGQPKRSEIHNKIIQIIEK